MEGTLNGVNVATQAISVEDALCFPAIFAEVAQMAEALSDLATALAEQRAATSSWRDGVVHASVIALR